VSTVGFELEKVKEYIAHQEKTELIRKRVDFSNKQLAVFETAHNRQATRLSGAL